MIVRKVTEHIVVEDAQEVEKFALELLADSDPRFLEVKRDHILIHAENGEFVYRIDHYESPGTLVAERMA